MLDINALLAGLDIITSSFTPWLIVIPGMIIGLVFGTIPGLQISMAMALFLPFTLYMDFLQAMLFLTAIFTGGSFGCGVPAILMNIPGTSAAVSTAFDGYPMAQRGDHNVALGLALSSSTIGVLIGYVILLLMIGPMSSLVLRLGPSELFIIIVWGITLIASLSENYMLRGMIAGGVGMLISTIGFSTNGYLRGTFDIVYLLDGIPVVPAMMGLFASSELFSLVNKKYLVSDDSKRKVSFSEILKGFKMAFNHKIIILRGSIIGIIIGAVPGVGSSISNLLSYIETKRRDKNPESFGKGNPKGVIASESANSSSEAGSMATLLALGLPGGGATAVMLAAFAMHNITGGPSFIRQQADVVHAIILANFGQVILLMVLGAFILPLLAYLVKIPLRFLIPSIMILATMGAFALTGNILGPIVVAVFSVLGWILRQLNFSIPAMVVGLLLGKMAESSLLQSYQISGGQISYVLERPITIALILFLLGSIFIRPLIKYIQNKSTMKN